VGGEPGNEARVPTAIVSRSQTLATGDYHSYAVWLGWGLGMLG